jgi:hypothetical protein
MFSSTPYERSQSFDMASLFSHGLPPIYYAIVLLLFASIVTFMSCCTGRFDPWNLIAAFLLNPSNRPIRRITLRIAYFACLFLSIMNYQFWLDSHNTDLVTMTPEKYYDSLADVVASNATPCMRANLSLEGYHRRTGDKFIAILMRRAAQPGTLFTPETQSAAITMARTINQTVNFYSGKSEANGIIAMSCVVAEYFPPTSLKLSAPFDVHEGIMTVSRSIRPGIRRHVSRYYQHVIESGIHQRYQSNSQ